MLSQFMAESLLLAVISGGVALLLAYLGIELLRGFGPPSLPRLREVRLDGHVLGFTAGISMLATLLFGLAPAWFATSSMSAEALREGSRAGTSRRRHSLGRALVVAETAMSICLLTGAGLLIVSLYRTLHTPPGFQVSNLISTEIMLPKSADADHRGRMIDQTLEAVRVLPGVESAGAISEMPIHNEMNDTTFDIAEHPSSNPQDHYDEDFRRVTPGYFQAMHIPLMRGRLITDTDVASSASVAVIDEPFARRYFKGENPVGKHILLQGPKEIVGVVGGVRNHSLRMAPQPTIYLPFAQLQSDNLHFVIRTSTDPAALSENVQRIVTSADPDAALSGFETMQHFIDSSLSNVFFDTLLLGLFAALALVLAMAGVYGVFSHIVTAQTREIGIRMALGARRGQILNRVLVHGITLAALGAILGLAAAFFLTNVLASQLYEINARNPLIFVFSAATLICVAILACSVPARRAMKVDPMVALRYE
jgi:putative ABC transport system permease protein